MSDTAKPALQMPPPIEASQGNKYIPPEAGISERIKTKRRELGLTVEELSAFTARLDFEQNDPEMGGVSAASIYRYEKEGEGKSLPGSRELRLLCEALDVSPNWLLLGSEWNQEAEADRKLADALRHVLELAATQRAFPNANESRKMLWTLHLQAVKEAKTKPRK